MTGFKHLLVDLDGTLLGSRDLFLRLGFIAGITREIRKREPRIGIFQSLRALHAMRMALETPGGARSNETRAAEAFGNELGIPGETAGKLLNEVIGTVFPRLERHFYPIPGASEFLKWAGSKYSLHLATNPVWPREVVDLRLKWAGIDPATFKSVTHAGWMHACKPHLDYYREVLKSLGAQASECLMVGDSAKKDLPASGIGISVYLLGKKSPSTVADFSTLRSYLEGS